LILGGCGFIGKNLVKYLATNDLVSKMCVSDKVPPQVNTGGLSEEERALFDNTNLVSFKQANLARENKVDEVFEHDGGAYQYVINLAGITKYSQPEEVYQENIVEVSRVCANAAKKI
jgi:nucleoside-diphosphate-sugar epimerase